VNLLECAGATAYNSSYVHRRLRRRLGLLGATTRLVATSAPRPGWARGRVTYEPYVMRNCARDIYSPICYRWYIQQLPQTGEHHCLEPNGRFVYSSRSPTILDFFLRIDSVRHMQYVPLIALALSAIGVVIASISFRHNKNLARLQVMEHLMMEYRSPEMLAALTSLHRLRDLCDRTGLDIQAEYNRIFTEDQRKLEARGDSREAIEYSTGTLHNQRRLVSHFYNRMNWLIDHNAVPASLVFSYWNSGDLDRLFNRILIPIKRDPVEWLASLYKKSLSAASQRRDPCVTIGILFFIVWAVLVIVQSFLMAFGFA
jgi:hypothetical protein